jgi:hypothetical protein
MRTIAFFNKLEKYLGASVTGRNWNTFLRLIEILRTGSTH